MSSFYLCLGKQRRRAAEQQTAAERAQGPNEPGSVQGLTLPAAVPRRRGQVFCPKTALFHAFGPVHWRGCGGSYGLGRWGAGLGFLITCGTNSPALSTALRIFWVLVWSARTCPRLGAARRVAPQKAASCRRTPNILPSMLICGCSASRQRCFPRLGKWRAAFSGAWKNQRSEVRGQRSDFQASEKNARNFPRLGTLLSAFRFLLSAFGSARVSRCPRCGWRASRSTRCSGGCRR